MHITPDPARDNSRLILLFSRLSWQKALLQHFSTAWYQPYESCYTVGHGFSDSALLFDAIYAKGKGSMSTTSVHEFIETLKIDTALAQQVAGLKASSQQITELARTRGYVFTATELEAALPNRPDQPKVESDRELTEEELDAVVGGAWSGYWTWNAATHQWVWTWVYSNSTGGSGIVS